MEEGEDREAGGRAQDDPEGREPLGYYYDDGTGYEIYRPEEDEEDEESEENEVGEEAGRPGGRGEGASGGEAADDERRGGVGR